MWRTLQNFPRALRAQWNTSVRSAPQSACRDDDNKVICTRKQAPLQIATRCYGISHQDENKRDEGTGHDRGWFKQHVQAKYGAWEAVGWSTAVVLGIQLSHLWHFYTRNKEQWRDMEAETRHKLCRLYHLATSMPGFDQRLHTSQRIRPVCAACPPSRELQAPESQEPPSYDKTDVGTSLQPKNFDKEAPDLEPPDLIGQHTYSKAKYKSLVDDLMFPFNELCEECISISHDEPSANVSQASEATAEPAPSANPDLGPIPEFAAEWEALCQTYVGIQGNEAGLEHAREGDHAAAFRCWQETAAATGYAKANFNTGLCYELGLGVEKDFNRASGHYSAAASAGHAKAAYNLAVLCLAGRAGGDPLALLQQAAQRGLPQAAHQLARLVQEQEPRSLFHLALCHEHGWGVAEDRRRAAELYRRAAEAGDMQAAGRMGSILQHGLLGHEVNLRDALKFYQKAACEGDTDAKQKVQQLQNELGLDKAPLAPLRVPRYRLPASQSSPTLGAHLRRHLLRASLVDWDLPLSDSSRGSQGDAVTSHLTSSCSRAPEADACQAGSPGGQQDAEQPFKKSRSTSALSEVRLRLLLGGTALLETAAREPQEPRVQFSVGEDEADCSVSFQLEEEGLSEGESVETESFDFSAMFGGGGFGNVLPARGVRAIEA